MNHEGRTRIAGPIPFGLGETKPHHFRDILRVAWENRDNLPYAWRILRHGVCDGCSLGPYGLKDQTVDGIHLCLTRLQMLRLNTQGLVEPRRLESVESLRRMSGEALRRMGRLAYPMRRRKGEPGFTRISWDEALDAIAGFIHRAAPERLAFHTTSRGLTNEVYYVAQKLARLLGTNNVDNAARLCHAASSVALKKTLGVGASTCSYSDWIGTDLVVLFGTDLANNQPVSLKYLYHAKKKGARIVVVNPYREPGLERYWVPSIPKSALFGTRMMDDLFQVNVGGDVAFANGVLKHLIAERGLDETFIRDHTSGFEEMKRAVDDQSWELLESRSGVGREVMLRFAKLYSESRTAVFIWSMGLTQHTFGVQNVQAVVNLALARGMIGRPNCGVVPIRGHSGVQGGAECGAVPNVLPGNFELNAETARRYSDLWGFPVPTMKGMAAPAMIEAAHRGELDLFYIMGGNFIDTLPDPIFVKAALERVPLRVHQDLVVNSSMLAEPSDTVILLPGQTRYEQQGGGTVTSTERRIRFSPEIPGPRLGETRSEWEILTDVGARALPPERARLLTWESGRALREEMDRAIPMYKGIGSLEKEGDAVQYGGPRLLEGGVCPAMPDGRARFSALEPPSTELADGEFYLATRRGRQFNSILYGHYDPLTGSERRDEVFVSRADAARLGLAPGARVKLSSPVGAMEGVVRIAPVRERTLQAFWPEANVLLPRRVDPLSNEPDYNVRVRVERLS